MQIFITKKLGLKFFFRNNDMTYSLLTKETKPEKRLS